MLMSPIAYYRRASLLPFLVPAVAAFVLEPLLPPGQTGLTTWLNLFAKVSLAGVLPYGLFLLVARIFFWPATAGEFRRLLLLAPPVVALYVASVAAILESISVGHVEAIGFLIAGGYGLAVGYAYVALIETGLAAAKRFRLISAT